MGLFDSIGNVLSTALTNRSNKKLTRETNQFNAQQAELNRQFQSQEAQIARDWQESQYNKYSSPEAMVRQYQEAGLNPALMYGQNLQTSTGSSPAPSGSQAQGTAIPMQSPSFSGIVDDIATLAKLKQEINESKSRENLNNQQANKAGSDVELNNQSIAESKQRISKLIEETESESAKRALIIAQELLAKQEQELKGKQSISIAYDNLKKEFEQAYRNKFGFYPEDNAISAVLQMFGQGVAEVEFFGKNIYNFVKKFFQ